MKNIAKVEGDPSLGRDLSTGAIINLNMDAYEAHIRNKKQKDSMAQRIENVEKSVAEIKDMFAILLEKIGNK